MVYDTIKKKQDYLQGLHPLWKNIYTWSEAKLNVIFEREHSKEVIEYAKMLSAKYSHEKESL